MRQLKIAMALVLVGGLLTTAAFFMAFFTAEVQSFNTVSFFAPVDTEFPLVSRPSDTVGRADLESLTETTTVSVDGWVQEGSIVREGETRHFTLVGSAEAVTDPEAEPAVTVMTTRAIRDDMQAGSRVHVSGDTAMDGVVQARTISGYYQYGQPWFSQKIFYFHVPVAEASFLVLIIAAYFSIRFLMTKRREYDTKARVAMETSLIFVVLTMITGVLWTKASWGVWWEWEPRLTTYFIMMLMMISYFVLRSSVEEDERRATYAAVFGILAAINAPISFMITRVIPSSHPVVFQSGMATSNLLPFIIGQIGMLMLGYGIYVLRMSEERLRDRVDISKEALEG